MIGTRHRLRRRLNQALHEARRPLQLLTLRGDPSVEICQIADALAEIDVIVNGGRPRRPREATAVGELVESAVARLRLTPLAMGRTIEVIDRTGEHTVTIERRRLTAAVENLVLNALEHGEGRVEVALDVVAGSMTLKVSNAAAEPARPHAADQRRGHGLDLVAATASREGGHFAVSEHGSQVVATLALRTRGRVAGAQ